jgi:hypothetical protein
LKGAHRWNGDERNMSRVDEGKWRNAWDARETWRNSWKLGPERDEKQKIQTVTKRIKRESCSILKDV